MIFVNGKFPIYSEFGSTCISMEKFLLYNKRPLGVWRLASDVVV